MKKTFLFSVMIAIMAMMVSCTKQGSNSIFMNENDQDSITCDTINSAGLETDSVNLY